MGADGGYNWVQARNKERADHLIGWMKGVLLNRYSKAYKYTDEPDCVPTSNDWYVGGYGTDCEDDLDSLRMIVRSMVNGPWCMRDEYGTFQAARCWILWMTHQKGGISA